MTKLANLFSGVVLAALPCTYALADAGMSFLGSAFSASADFTYTPTSTPDIYLASGITGSATVFGTDVSITGMAPILSYAANDNLFYTGAAALQIGGRPFDFNGLAFTLSNGDVMNLYSTGGVDYELLGVFAGGATIAQDSVPITVTPEPGSLVLLGTGSLGLLGMIRRKLVS